MSWKVHAGSGHPPPAPSPSSCILPPYVTGILRASPRYPVPHASMWILLPTVFATLGASGECGGSVFRLKFTGMTERRLLLELSSPFLRPRSCWIGPIFISAFGPDSSLYMNRSYISTNGGQSEACHGRHRPGEACGHPRGSRHRGGKRAGGAN